MTARSADPTPAINLREFFSFRVMCRNNSVQCDGHCTHTREKPKIKWWIRQRLICRMTICVRCRKRERNNLRKHLFYSGFLDKAFPVMELITSDMILCTPFGNEETTGSLILDFQGPVLKFHLVQSLIDTGHANTSFIALHNFCKSCNSSINRDIIAEI